MRFNTYVTFAAGEIKLVRRQVSTRRCKRTSFDSPIKCQETRTDFCLHSHMPEESVLNGKPCSNKFCSARNPSNFAQFHCLLFVLLRRVLVASPSQAHTFPHSGLRCNRTNAVPCVERTLGARSLHTMYLAYGYVRATQSTRHKRQQHHQSVDVHQRYEAHTNANTPKIQRNRIVWFFPYSVFLKHSDHKRQRHVIL